VAPIKPHQASNIEEQLQEGMTPPPPAKRGRTDPSVLPSPLGHPSSSAPTSHHLDGGPTPGRAPAGAAVPHGAAAGCNLEGTAVAAAIESPAHSQLQQVTPAGGQAQGTANPAGKLEAQEGPQQQQQQQQQQHWPPQQRRALTFTALAALHVWRECGAHAAQILGGACDLRTNSQLTDLMEAVLALLWAPMSPLALLASLGNNSGTAAGSGNSRTSNTHGASNRHTDGTGNGNSSTAAAGTGGGTADCTAASGAATGGSTGRQPEEAEDADLIKGAGGSWSALLTGLTEGVLTR
jgi:hypothetical protein